MLRYIWLYYHIEFVSIFNIIYAYIMNMETLSDQKVSHHIHLKLILNWCWISVWMIILLSIDSQNVNEIGHIRTYMSACHT